MYIVHDYSYLICKFSCVMSRIGCPVQHQGLHLGKYALSGGVLAATQIQSRDLSQMAGQVSGSP